VEVAVDDLLVVDVGAGADRDDVGTAGDLPPVRVMAS
jgi:hypothetical protein